MNQRDLKNFKSIDELWDRKDRKLKEEFGLFYLDDKAEDIKNK